MARVPLPPVTRLALSAFCGAIAHSLVDLKKADEPTYQAVWEDMRFLVSYFRSAIPETHAEHQPAVTAMFDYLQELQDNLEANFQAQDQSQHQAAVQHRRMYVQLSEILEQLDLPSSDPPSPPDC